VLQIPLEPPISVSYDFGAVLRGYCYDYGRSVFFGEPDAEYRRVHELVMTSQAAGIAALRRGQHLRPADAAARQVIVDGGYGPAFRHRLGHGIGMDVHEPPFLTASDSTVLEARHVLHRRAEHLHAPSSWARVSKMWWSCGRAAASH
jgi:Xaa-Pro dipeptidase